MSFWNKKIKKSNFYKNTKLFKIDEIDTNKTLLWKKEPYPSGYWGFFQVNVTRGGGGGGGGGAGGGGVESVC